VPVFFRSTEVEDGAAKDARVRTMYLEARTTTVPRSLSIDTQILDFGEVPVALRLTKEILVKNVGNRDEELRL